jgi:hypothetical protein
LNGVSPGANWPFERAPPEHRQFSRVFQKTTIVLLNVSKPWDCQQAYRMFVLVAVPRLQQILVSQYLLSRIAQQSLETKFCNWATLSTH